MKTLKYARSFEVVPNLPPELAALRTLAYNFRWTWHSPTRDLFAETDPKVWEASGHNPVALINGLSPRRLEKLAADKLYLARLQECADSLEEYLGADAWFQREYPEEKETKIAYFCAEFGLSECLPIYSGGLGILAGDHLKSSSDLGIPLVGIGLLYARGYFRQTLTEDGWQQEHYPILDFYKLPLALVRGSDGQPLTITVEFPDRNVHCQIWRAQVGRVPLYLLDSNVLENEPKDQNITDTLYGGDEEMRIRQECVLGIGGYRALKALGITPTVCHMNEGHAAFSALERISSLMKDEGLDYRTARQCVSAGNVFTTHTPVPAGFDLFNRTLLEKYLTRSIGSLGLSFDELLRQGRIHKDNTEEHFNMAVLAMENSSRVNGVSKLHAQVSRSMFHGRWPQFPTQEVPIDPVTNGIHTLSWISPKVEEMLDGLTDGGWRSDATDAETWSILSEAGDKDLWALRQNQRGDFIRFCRDHVSRTTMRSQPWRRGANSELLDPRILTIGFARRFATYKRATLLFSDRERLKALLTHPDRPVQFVFAGKAHPRDDGGKRLIQDIVKYVRENGLANRMVFLEDYDISVARQMISGVDVWLNNPRRPMEASGTSGMKVLPNGGLNFSILDGWWAEGHDPRAGWAIGDGSIHPDQAHQDWLDSQALYGVLENEIIPKFYDRDDSDVPVRWVQMMRASMAGLTPEFSTDRMVRDYARLYAGASRAYRHLIGSQAAGAKDVLQWRDRVRNAWSGVKLLGVADNGDAIHEPGAELHISATVDLNGLSPEDVEVQALLGEVGPNRELQNVSTVNLAPSEDAAHFSAKVECLTPGHRGFIVRIIPRHADINVLAELPLVKWQESAH